MAECTESWAGSLPELDIEAHLKVTSFVAGLVSDVVSGHGAPKLVHAVHDVSGGGVAVALAEMAAAAGIGCRLAFDEAAELFTELPSRFVMSTADPRRLRALAERKGVPAAVLGRVGGLRLTLGSLVDLPISAVMAAHNDNLARRLGDL
jgi:phosphoribosylformylglycinamidine synthase